MHIFHREHVKELVLLRIYFNLVLKHISLRASQNDDMIEENCPDGDRMGGSEADTYIPEVFPGILVVDATAAAGAAKSLG